MSSWKTLTIQAWPIMLLKMGIKNGDALHSIGREFPYRKVERMRVGTFVFASYFKRINFEIIISHSHISLFKKFYRQSKKVFFIYHLSVSSVRY